MTLWSAGKTKSMSWQKTLAWKPARWKLARICRVPTVWLPISHRCGTDWCGRRLLARSVSCTAELWMPILSMQGSQVSIRLVSLEMAEEVPGHSVAWLARREHLVCQVDLCQDWRHWWHNLCARQIHAIQLLDQILYRSWDSRASGCKQCFSTKFCLSDSAKGHRWVYRKYWLVQFFDCSPNPPT